MTTGGHMFSGTLSFLSARERDGELRKAAKAHPTCDRHTPVTRVTLRYAGAADAPRLARLAALDSAVAPRGPALVAEVDGQLRAALPLDGGRPIADPFNR